MTLTLTGELEQFVRDEVKRGAFASSSEYVRDLIRERFVKERDRAAKVGSLDAALARGIADAKAGRVMPLDEAFRRLRQELEAADTFTSISKVKVVITEAAYADMAGIGRYISQDNPRRSVSFVDDLHARCQQIGQTPYAYPLLPNWEDLGIRRRVFGSYLIFYRIWKDDVEILHVLHGARDYEAILFPDD